MKSKKKRLQRKANNSYNTTENVSETIQKETTPHPENLENPSPHPDNFSESTDYADSFKDTLDYSDSFSKPTDYADSFMDNQQKAEIQPHQLPQKKSSLFSRLTHSFTHAITANIGIFFVCALVATTVVAVSSKISPKIIKMAEHLLGYSAYNIKLVEETQGTPLNILLEPVIHKIRVENHGKDQVLLRIQLKEYMEVAGMKPDYYKDEEGEPVPLLAVSGRLVRIPAHGNEKKPAAEYLMEYGYNRTYLRLQGQTDEQEYWYILCDSEKEESRFLQIGFLPRAYTPLIDNGVSRAAPQEANALHNTAECKYDIHEWSIKDHLVCKRPKPKDKNYHDYFQWTLGDNVLLLSELPQKITQPTWILDNCSSAAQQGWAYWSEPLLPGDSTQNLLETITLIFEPEGSFHYTIHADVEAIPLDRLERWNDLPTSLLNYWRKQLPTFNNSEENAAMAK